MTTQPDEEEITVKPSGSNETVHDDIVSSAAAVDDNYPRPTNDDDDDDNDAERDECVDDDDAHPADGSTWDSVSLLEGKTSFHGKDAEEDIGGETLVSTDNLTEKPRAEAEEEAKSEILNQDEEQERPQQNHSVEKKNYLHDEEKSDLQPDDAHVLKETSNMSTPDEDPEAENGTHDGTQQQDNSNFQQYAMELNVALEALESMRKANLEVEFSTTSSALLSGNSPPIPFSAVASVSKVNHDKCTYCQRDTLNKYISNPDLLLAKIEKEKKRISGVNTSNNATVEGRNERGGIKFDGSRIRRFKNRFLSKSTTSNSSIAASSSASTLNSDADDAKNEAMKSCPPRLENSNDDSNTTNASDVETSERNTPGSISSAAIDKQSPQNINNPNEKSVLRRKPIPCLTCGHPTCSSHSSPTFSTKQIPICQPCAYLFELDFLVDVIATASASTDDGNNSNTHDQTLAIQTTCRQKVNDMIDCYDRAKLLLTYTAQYTDQIAQSLETRTARSNKIGAGSSATGLVSGITGVVGCSALLFPPVAAVGVPLLIASLVFGGTATAAQTGEAAVQYFSEPDRLADKMVALHGMALSLLRITEVLNYGLLKEDDGTGNGEEKMEENGSVVSDEPSSEREEMAKEIQALLEKHGINTSIAVKGTSDKGTTGASMTGRHSRYIGRVGTTAMSSARFIPVAGGVLSAACMVVEGRELKTTLSRISDGNLSAKADRIRTIREELPHLPDSSLIADECRRVFELAEKQRRKRSAAAAAAATTSNGQHDEDSKTFPSNEQHDEEEEDENESLNATADSSTSRQSRSKSSGNNFDNMDFDGMEISDMIDEMQYAAMAESDREIAHVMNSLDHR